MFANDIFKHSSFEFRKILYKVKQSRYAAVIFRGGAIMYLLVYGGRFHDFFTAQKFLVNFIYFFAGISVFRSVRRLKNAVFGASLPEKARFFV